MTGCYALDFYYTLILLLTKKNEKKHCMSLKGSVVIKSIKHDKKQNSKRLKKKM